MKNRTETDSMGPIEVDSERYWGAQTERARRNFQVSPHRIPTPFLRALCLIKGEAARTNAGLGLLEARIALAIEQAAHEAFEGRFDGEFPLDVFQTGSGTSWNMNANEVLAGRANELLGSSRGGKSPVHPNDHVNLGQSSNDVIPATLNVSCRLEAARFATSLDRLAAALEAKASEFASIVKIGRTHLQDAVPMTLGNEFGAFARQVRLGAERVRATFGRLEELALGGTALGTGLNTHPEFGARTAAALATKLGVGFHQAENLYEAIAARDSQVELMGALNTVATSLLKIGNDLRLLSSGPRTGFGEILLPSLQPGSSIMPGKVNPVILEMLNQACAHVMGKHLSVTIAGQNAPLQLNIMMPLLAHETLSSLELLTRCVDTFSESCVLGIVADERRASEQVERSLALVTPLALVIGYDRAAALSKQALAEDKTIRQLVLEQKLLSEKDLNSVLDPRKLAGL
ncbi:MAG: class II fumarate hydratase [Spirochaetales bacterium]